MVLCTFSPARAWRPAVAARLARTLGSALHASAVHAERAPVGVYRTATSGTAALLHAGSASLLAVASSQYIKGTLRQAVQACSASAMNQIDGLQSQSTSQLGHTVSAASELWLSLQANAFRARPRPYASPGFRSRLLVRLGSSRNKPRCLPCPTTTEHCIIGSLWRAARSCAASAINQ